MKNMAKQQLLLLALAGLLGAVTQKDLCGKAFVFPKTSKTAHVILKSRLEQPLQTVTVCLRYFSDLARPYSLFSYATKAKDNELLLFKPKPGELSLYIAGEMVTFKVPENTGIHPRWEHVCSTWESATGVAELWVNGSPLPRKGLKKGYSISAEGVIVLEQEQDSPGGGFDSNQSFEGELTDVYMWHILLSPAEVSVSTYNCLTIASQPHPILDWRNLTYEIKDYVVIKPNLLSVY